LVILGGCVVLLLVSGPTGPLVLLTIGVTGMAVSRIGAGFRQAKQTNQK
jgi:hypothetical protein